ncbi:MAG: FHA domain-containing protein [Planctomycetota bacterium]
MVKVIVEVISGASVGRKVPIQTGEKATFGTSEASDVCLEDPEMGKIQFALQCESESFLLQSLSPASTVLVNDQPVDDGALHDGDEISAGQTRLRVSFTGMSSETTLDRENETTEPPKVTAEELCRLIELDEEGMQLLSPDQSPSMFVDTLVAEDRFVDAVRLIAYALTKSQAVKWAHEGISEIGSPEKRTPQDQVAIEATGKWIEDEAEANRRTALISAEELEFATAPACVAAAAGWSGGSMVSPDLDPIEPDHLLTARMASIAIQIAALEPGDDLVDARYKQAIEKGKAMLTEPVSSGS